MHGCNGHCIQGKIPKASKNKEVKNDDVKWELEKNKHQKIMILSDLN